MCRVAAYVGPPRSLHELWLAPPHNLVVQSYAPRQMNGALLNADGFGMAWYTAATVEPALYRSVLPLWGDENVTRIAPHLVTGHAIANVRSATPGMAIQTSNVSPFVRGRFAFTHNGLVRSFRASWMRTVRETIGDAHYAAIEGSTDSEHLFALVLTHLEGLDPLADPSRRLAAAIAHLEAIVEDAMLLNVILCDGRWLVAVRHAVGETAPSLYHRFRDDGGREIASEPLDGGAWTPFEPSTMLVLTPTGEARIEAL